MQHCPDTVYKREAAKDHMHACMQGKTIGNVSEHLLFLLIRTI